MRTPRRLILSMVSFCALAFLAVHPATADKGAASRAMTAVARQPLRFESLDRGLLTRGGGYAMMLNRGSADVSLSGTARVVRMTWPGADQSVQPVGDELAAGTTNYLIGSDPSQWRRGVQSFRKVRYRDLYPAIDLVFYGNQEQLEYDFVVAPGGDPRDIRLRFHGQDAVRIDKQGNLVLRSGRSDIIQHAPVIYQEHNGTRRQIAGRYARLNRHEFGFSIADFDRAKTLYIDPVLTFSSFLGGNVDTYGKAVAVDAAGNAYVTGYTAATNFPTTSGVYGTSCATCASNANDVFVTKISPTGVLVYSTYVGSAGSTDDRGYAIAVDSAGNAYVTGETSYSGSGPAFPVVNGFTLEPGTGAFLFKLNATGSNLLYSTHLRSGSSTVGFGVAVEGSNAYVAGMTVAGNNFPLAPSSNTYSGSIGPVGSYDAFIAKINTSASGLSSLAWATRFGGWDLDYAFAVAVNPAGEAFVTGETTSDDFPSTIGSAQPGCGSDSDCNNRVRDAFVTRFNAAGNALQYSTFAGGTNRDSGFGIAIDPSGNAYVTGHTYSPDFPVTVGAFRTTCGNDGLCDLASDVFTLKLPPSGSSFVYSTYLGGGFSDEGRAIVVDSDGYAHVAGSTYSTNFPITLNAIQPSRGGTNNEAFVSVFDPSGTSLVYSSYLGGSGGVSGGDQALGIALDLAGDVWVAGQTDSADFPVKPGAVQTTHGAALFDAFVVKIGEALSLTAVIPSSGGTSGGPVRLTGTGFMAGATVSFGGVAATSVSVLSPTTITAVRPARAPGAVNVVVTSLDGQVATLVNGFTYVSIPPLTFTNDPLQAQVTPVRAVHFTELRTAVNTIRTRYGLPVVNWPSGAINSGTVIQAAHLTELRSALAAVYTAAGMAVPVWSPATITGGATIISAAPITQVRAATLAMW